MISLSFSFELEQSQTKDFSGLALKSFWRSSVIFSKNHHRVSLIIFFFKCTFVATKKIRYIIQEKKTTNGHCILFLIFNISLPLY